MYETYLPAFEACVKEADVESIMGAYNRVNGEPACGSKTLLQDILLKKWGFAGYITSDCWAIADFHLHHKVTEKPVESVKLALDNGCYLNCGCTYEHVLHAVELGMITEEQVRHAATKLMTTRMKLGMFDAHTPFDHLDLQDVDTPYNRDVNYRMACESLVLLKNNGILPLNPEKLGCVAVMGPNANSIVALEGNYHGTANQYHTVLESIRAALPGTVTVSQYNSSYGYYVMIDHGNGLSTLYGHNSQLLAQVGQTVEAGDIISLSGSTGRSTGPHLHFEVRVNGQRTNPRAYLPPSGG